MSKNNPGVWGLAAPLLALFLLLSLADPNTVTAGACAAQRSGIVSWWGGDNSALDLSGESDGSLINGATYGAGNVGQAFSLDGVDDFVDAGAAAAFDFGGGAADFTIATWLKLASYPPALTANHATIVHKSTFNPYSGWGLYVYADGSLGFGGIGVWEFASAAGAIPTGTWVHVAVTRQGSSYRLYKDGEEIATATHGNLETSTAPLEIGSAFNATNAGGVFSDTRLHGLVDETMVFGRALTAADLQAIFEAGDAGVCRPCAPLPAGAVSRWRGDASGEDSVGANDATPRNGALFASGKVRGALKLDGVDDYADAGTSDAFNFGGGTGDFTIESWIKPLAMPAVAAGIVSKATQGPFSGWAFYFYADGRLGFGGVGSWEVASAPGTVAAGAWAHVAVTKTGSVYRLYKSGVEVGSRDFGDLQTSSAPLLIGTDYVDALRFNGLIDEIGIFARALSTGELAAVVNAGNAGACPAGLLSWWRADGTAEDLLGTHDGALQGEMGFATGVAGQAFSFDGVDDNVELGPWFDLQSFTIEFWANPGGTQKTYANIVDNNHRSGISWVMQQNGDTLNEYGYGTADGGAGPLLQLPAGEWTHVVMTRDAATMANALYANGDLVHSWQGTADVNYNGSQFLRLGKWGGTCCSYLDRHWSGLLDEVKAYDRALSGVEVAALGGRPRAPEISPAPAALDFGAVLPGAAPTRTLSLSNTGTADVVLGSIALAGADAAEFELRDNICAGQTLAPFDSCTLTVAYLRATSGAKSARVEILSNDPGGSPAVVALAGRGITCVPPPTGLTSWWPAEGDASDAVGAGDGAPANGASFAPGRVGQAFSLDGIDDYVQMGGGVGVFGSDPFTVAFWMRAEEGGNGSYLIGASHPDGGLGWDLRLHGGSLHVVGVNGWPAQYNLATEAALTPATWHHVAVSASASVVEAYIDGVLRGSVGRLPISASPNPLRIGYTTAFGGTAFKGLIDEVGIYDRQLTGEEVAGLAGADGGVCPGAYAGMEPASHDFGDVAVGEASAAREFVLSNTGLASLTVSGVSLGGTDAAAFTFAAGGADPCPGTYPLALAPGESCTLVADFRPATSGVRNARLQVAAEGVSQLAPGADLAGRGVYQLQVAADPEGGGRVTGGAVDCPGVCGDTATGGTIDLTATAAAGWHFVGWSGDAAGSDAQATVAMDGHRAVTATFAIDTHAVAISRDGSGTGSVSTVPAGGGIDCGATCNGSYEHGTTITLRATPAVGSSFGGWGGDCGGSGDCTLTILGPRAVVATFTHVPVERTVCASGCDFDKAQDAIDAAGPGDTVLLAAGTHRGNLVVSVDQNLTLRGAGARPSATVLSGDLNADGAGDGTVLRVDPTSGPGGVLRVENLTITQGAGAPDGGGVAVRGTAGEFVQMVLDRVVVRKNRATGGGGGLLALCEGGGGVDVRLENAMVTENTAASGAGMRVLSGPGGALATLQLVNATVAGNAATVAGGGLEASSAADGEVAVKLVNSILRGNRAPAGAEARLAQEAGTLTLDAHHSAVGAVLNEGAAYIPGAGMVAGDPVFVNPAAPAGGDFHLNADSPCLGAADAGWAPAKDFEGNARPQGAGHDVGADESVAKTYAKVTLLSLRGGESIPGGAVYNVNWGAPASAAKFKVFWSRDQGLTWRQVGTGFTTLRHKAWKPPVPAATAKTWKVRVDGFTSGGAKVGSATGGLFTVRK